jgi:predicted nucleotide-binding protein
LIKNAKELGIITVIKETEYIQLNKISPPVEGKQIPLDTKENGDGTPRQNEDTIEVILPDESSESQKPTFKPKVFIGHSKNAKILNQLKEILEFGQFDYVIAEETETSAIPISEKVFGLMKDCNCAIINLSADGQENEEEDIRINQNVLIEIGAAFLKYNKKVILLTDKRLVESLPSNIQGLVRCDYDGDELSFTTALKLQKSLTCFR